MILGLLYDVYIARNRYTEARKKIILWWTGIQIDEFCIKTDGFCVKHDELCIKQGDTLVDSNPGTVLLV